MTRYDPHPALIEAKLVEVGKMVDDVMKRYHNMTAKSIGFSACGAPGNPVYVADSGAVQAAAKTAQNDLAQYERFLKREPSKNTMDKRILAEAAVIRDDIHGSRERLCIASNDTGIFAPLRLRGGYESAPIVGMIRDRFAIECGRPSTIRALCTGA